MSNEQSQRVPRKLLDALKTISSVIVVLALLVIGFRGSHYLASHPDSSASHPAVATESQIPIEVTLTDEKVASADIHICEVACIDLQRTKTVAATVEYDSTRHLSVETPVESVVERWFVKPGQVVAKGEPLAVLSGAEIALARNEIKKCEAAVRISQINFDWSRETQDNLVELLASLRAQPSVEDVESQFDGKRLGEHRDHLISTYTQYVLASNVAKRSKPLGDRGIIAGSTAEARSSLRDVAAIRFQAACEQSEFEGRQALAKSEAELELAQQNVAIARDRLRLLLGPLANESSTGASGDFEVRAPFGGRVEALHSSPASRLSPGEPVLTLADTSKLWVSALVHQHDWDALQFGNKQTLRVTVPAIPNEAFAAHVSFIGPEVSPSTRAVSIVAELDNDNGRFRPGMFAWVDLPMELARKGLVVPTSAIQRHESKAFVFSADPANCFRRIDVSTGVETADYVEITAGLSAGQRVVDRGAFFLKSELLLEQEAE